MLPVGYVVSASRIADRRMILEGYGLADLLMRVHRSSSLARSKRLDSEFFRPGHYIVLRGVLQATSSATVSIGGESLVRLQRVVYPSEI